MPGTIVPTSRAAQKGREVMYTMKHSQRGDVSKGERGFTMIEIVVVLAVIALLTAVLSPMVIKYVRDARIAKAAADTMAIGVAIAKLEQDVHHYPYHSVATGNLRDDQRNVTTLVGPGEAPTESAIGKKWLAGDTQGCLNGTYAQDALNRHLVTNAAAWNTSRTQDKPYSWGGPYLQNLTPDPWGNQYLVNITNASADCIQLAFALSAGPNGKIETGFDQPTSAVLMPGGDDIIYQIR